MGNMNSPPEATVRAAADAAIAAGLGGFQQVIPGKPGLLSRKVAHIFLFDQGLVYVGDKRPVPYVLRWDSALCWSEIELLVGGGTERTSYRYRLQNAAGEKLFLSGHPSPEIWSKAISEGIFEARLPLAVAALQRGEGVDFGAAALFHDRLILKNHTIRWAELRGYDQFGRLFQLSKRGRVTAINVSLNRIPNFPVFLTLLSAVSGVPPISRRPTSG